MLDLEFWASGSILTGGNILLLEFFGFHVVKTLKSIMALLPFLCISKKTPMWSFETAQDRDSKTMGFYILYYAVYTPKELAERCCICLCLPVQEGKVSIWSYFLSGSLVCCFPGEGGLGDWSYVAFWEYLSVVSLSRTGSLSEGLCHRDPLSAHLMAHTTVSSRHPTWVHECYSIHLFRRGW